MAKKFAKPRNFFPAKISDNKVNHIVCISKMLTDLCFTKQKIETKNAFAKVVYNVEVANMFWSTIKKFCLCIDCAQPVRLEKRAIELKNLFKQMLVPFKIYSDFGCILSNAESYKGSSSKKYQDHIPRSFPYKIVCVDDKFTKPIVL